jgi:hypothetical protein
MEDEEFNIEDLFIKSTRKAGFAKKNVFLDNDTDQQKTICMDSMKVFDTQDERFHFIKDNSLLKLKNLNKEAIQFPMKQKQNS